MLTDKQGKVNLGQLSVPELGVKAVDNKTLIIQLEQATPYFLEQLTHQTGKPLHQKSVETLTYGSELATAKIAVELVIGFRYQLRMLGVNIDGPAIMLGDNMSVVLNTKVPYSSLKKKCNAIAYQRVREAITANIINFAHVNSKDNFVDVCTKPLGAGAFHRVVRPILFRVSSHLQGGDNNEDNLKF